MPKKEEAGKGERFDFPREEIHDAQTGRLLWKVSPGGTASAAGYMHINNFSSDERYLFYARMEKGEDQAFFYRYEIESGETVRLNPEPSNPHCANIHPETQELFYRDTDNVVWAVKLSTLELRQVFDGKKHAGRIAQCSGQIMFSPSGAWFSFPVKDAAGRIGVGRARCDGTGEPEILHLRPEREGVRHVQFAGCDDDTLSFAPAPDHQQEWYEPDMVRARTYLLHAASGTVEPLIVMPPPCAATHEYWGPEGRRVYFHRKTCPTWVPTWLCSIDRTTREFRLIYRNDSSRLGHSHVNPGETKIVTDNQMPYRNELRLVDIATGASEILCWPNSSVQHPSLGHVHPSFSPSGRYILYTSDCSGEPQVYLLPLEGA